MHRKNVSITVSLLVQFGKSYCIGHLKVMPISDGRAIHRESSYKRDLKKRTNRTNKSLSLLPKTCPQLHVPPADLKRTERNALQWAPVSV